MSLAKIHNEIITDPDNLWAHEKNWLPLYSAHPSAKIAIIGQAPGRLAQESATAWNDPSGRNLRRWMGVDDAVFYDQKQISILPMDFYFPGTNTKKGARGDLPPRTDFAEKWHGRILKHMPDIQLTLLIGQYAQRHYLRGKRPKTLTQTVQDYHDFLPDYFPLVHPSPRNYFWHGKNPWFVSDVVPVLQSKIKQVLAP